MLKSLSHFEFIFVHGMRVCSKFIGLHAAVQLCQHHLLEETVFHFIFLPPLWKTDGWCVGLFLSSLFCSIDPCLFLYQYHTIFHSGCTNLHSHWQCRRRLFLSSCMSCLRILEIKFLSVASTGSIFSNSNRWKTYSLRNYKILIKENKEYSKKWRDIPCSWIGRMNVVKMAILPKAIYRFSVIPISK